MTAKVISGDREIDQQALLGRAPEQVLVEAPVEAELPAVSSAPAAF